MAETNENIVHAPEGSYLVSCKEDLPKSQIEIIPYAGTPGELRGILKKIWDDSFDNDAVVFSSVRRIAERLNQVMHFYEKDLGPYVLTRDLTVSYLFCKTIVEPEPGCYEVSGLSLSEANAIKEELELERPGRWTLRWFWRFIKVTWE